MGLQQLPHKITRTGSLAGQSGRRIERETSLQHYIYRDSAQDREVQYHHQLGIQSHTMGVLEDQGRGWRIYWELWRTEEKIKGCSRRTKKRWRPGRCDGGRGDDWRTGDWRDIFGDHITGTRRNWETIVKDGGPIDETGTGSGRLLGVERQGRSSYDKNYLSPVVFYTKIKS